MQRRGSERRKFVRVDDTLVASVEPTGHAAGAAGHTLNFSAGGVLLLLPATLAAGTPLRVVLRPDEETEIAFDARVVRCRTQSDHAHEIAAEFVGGSAADHRRMQDEISRRVGREPVPPLPPLTA
jgi:c-di-GMP-binding flagellar brake protein YcgR